MAYKNPKQDRNYKKEYEEQKARKENPARAERARARYAYDKAGINRDGMDIDHIKPVSKGGTDAPANLRLVPPSQNRSFDRNKDHSLRRNVPLKKTK